MRHLREIFDDRLTKAAAAVLVLMLAVLAFNTFSDLPFTYPLLGMATFTLQPLLFVLGGALFVLAIRRV